MTIDDYKAALKDMIDATDDEAILKHWKTQLEQEFEQYRQQQSDQPQDPSPAEPTANNDADKDDASGYVVLESGLGIDE
jgi:hypothetical protein